MIFIGIDSGTQSTKAIALDLDNGAIIAQSQQAYELIPGLPAGHLEQNPQDWTAAVDATVSDCLQQIGPRRAELKGIGVSGQQHGLVVLDDEDRSIRPAKLWCDTSTVEQCDQFSEAFGGPGGLIALAGNAMLPGYTIPKLLWLKQHEPEHFAATRSVLLPHDYINFWLTGMKRLEFGDASGMGILNIRTREWSSELIDFVDPRVHEMLPPLGSSNSAHGTLRRELAEKWGVSADVMVSAGGGDNMMGAIGTGNIRDGLITASLGTSGTLYGVSGSPIIDPEGEVAAFCDSTDHWMPLVCTMNVTVVTEQIRQLFGLELEDLEDAVNSAPAGAGGLLFLPYLNGERTPNLPNASGVLHGLRTDNLTPANLARAAMEGATLGLAYGLKRFRDLGMNPAEIRLTGGGSKSPAWRQIAADAFGVPVVTLTTAEGAGLGAAIQAAFTATGGERDYADLCGQLVTVDESSRCNPEPSAVSHYAGQLDRQINLTRNLADAGQL